MSVGCNLCPRCCNAERSVHAGFCGATDKLKIARAALHFWEEPCISGERGSGTIFFSGCPLKCCFCQNYKISSEAFGKEITVQRLADIMLSLQDKGAHNINLVTAAPYLHEVIDALDRVKPLLSIPVVYNTGGYETEEALGMLDGYVDIYLPDLKYLDSETAEKYSYAKDYPKVAVKAIETMLSQTGKYVLDDDGLMKRGTIIRHLVLPGNISDTENILKLIKEKFGSDVLVSLMSQYTPFYKASEHKELNRRVSTYEYKRALAMCEKLGIDGYMQERSSAKEEYTPPFDLEGVE